MKAMKWVRGLVLAACLLGMVPRAKAADQWVWFSHPYAFFFADQDWGYFNPSDTQWCLDFGPGGQWSHLGQNALANGWAYLMYPYAYSQPTRRWFYLNEGDTQWVYYFGSAAWRRLGEAPANILEFPFSNAGDIIRMAAYGIPNWSGTEPHNGIDLQVTNALTHSAILSPAAGTVTRIQVSENPFSNPINQLMVTVTILTPSGLEVSLVLEPSTADPTLKSNQVAAIYVTEGQTVGVGNHVADLLVGTLGYPHLHYMVMKDGEFVCAYAYSTPAAQATFATLAQIPASNLPDGNICYGEP